MMNWMKLAKTIWIYTNSVTTYLWELLCTEYCAKNFEILCFMCMSVYTYLCVVYCLQRPKRALISGTGVIVIYKPPLWALGTKSRFSTRTASAFNKWAISLALQQIFLMWHIKFHSVWAHSSKQNSNPFGLQRILFWCWNWIQSLARANLLLNYQAI